MVLKYEKELLSYYILGPMNHFNYTNYYAHTS